MTWFQQLGILAALEAEQQKRDAEQKKIDDAYGPLIRVAQWLDRLSKWLKGKRREDAP